MRIYIGVIAAMLVGGCASVVPESIRTTAAGNIQIAQVREQPQQFRHAVVRWGGKIVSTRNERDYTVLEIIGRELDSEGRPNDEDNSLGRFLAKVQGFLDPAIYKADRELTVFGQVEDVVERSVGEYRYNYPLVQAEQIYLWKPRLPTPRYWYRDPFFYDPWYPWGLPYYRHFPY